MALGLHGSVTPEQAQNLAKKRAGEVADARDHKLGYTDLFHFVSFSVDGRRIVTGSDDNTVRVWDTETGKQLRVLSGHKGPITAASFGMDGRRIVTGSDDNTVRVWDTETGKQLRVLSGHKGPITATSFGMDGRRIVTGSRDETARVWDAETGQQVHILLGHSGTVHSALLSADGGRIATTSYGGSQYAMRVWALATPRVWDLAHQRKQRELSDAERRELNVE